MADNSIPPRVAEIITVPIADIVRDRELQPRAGEDPALIRKYSTLYEQGSRFPPVVCFRVADALLLADGWHRLRAQERLGLNEIDVEVHHGDRRQAILFGIEHNSFHGAPFTTADKRKAIDTCLRDPVWSLWSASEIGRRIGCDHKTVTARQRLMDSTSAVGSGKAKVDRGNSPTPPATPKLADLQSRTRGMAAIAAFQDAIAELIAAYDVDQVQSEIVKWWGAHTPGGTVKFDKPWDGKKGKRA